MGVGDAVFLALGWLCVPSDLVRFDDPCRFSVRPSPHRTQREKKTHDTGP